MAKGQALRLVPATRRPHVRLSTIEEEAMATQPETPPDTIEPQSPTELPPRPDEIPSEPPPGIDEPGRGPEEYPGPSET